jgi:lambda repressor-like predicted transcriptional regulator
LRAGAADRPGASAADAALRAALSEMKTGALRKRAREAGVSQDALDGSEDAECPRDDLIALIVAAAPAVGGASEKGAALRAELSGMKMGALRKKAREAGVAEEDLDDLEDKDDPRAALVELLATHLPTAAPGADTAEAAEAELRAELRFGSSWRMTVLGVFHSEPSVCAALYGRTKALKGSFGVFLARAVG